MNLFIDIETYSDIDIACGLDNYKTRAELLLLAYKIDDQPTRLWDVTTGAPPPPEFVAAFENPETVLLAHNAAFERTMLNGFGFPTAIERWQCSMARALSHALPDDLDTLGRVIGLRPDQAKIKDGKRLIRLFCMPLPANRKLRRADRTTHPEDWKLFGDYCVRDVDALAEIWKRLPVWNWQPADIALWHLDQRINERGFYADAELAHAGAEASRTEKAHLAARFAELTGGLAPTQRAQVQAHLNERFGLSLTSTAKASIEPIVKDKGTPPELREICQIVLDANKSSTAKYPAVAQRIAPDGRLRGALQFAGAGRTRRWAGRGAQFQNLPSRGLPSPAEIELFIELLKQHAHDLFFDNLMLFGAAALRGLVIAPPGRKLVCADLSNIEGRMLAWVAGEQWKLAAFREYDAGTGPDLYNVTANMIIGVDPWKVSKKDRNVFGKVPDLACLTGNTPIVTHRGVVAMVEVLPTDLLWDGVEWVKHEGLIDQGVRPVVAVDGIEATPDHLIRTGTTWTPAQELASHASTLSQALATGSANLPYWVSSAGQRAACGMWSCSAHVEPPRTAHCSPISFLGALRAALRVLGRKAARLSKRIGDTSTSAPILRIGAGCSIESPLASIAAGTRTMPHIPTMEGEASPSSPSGSRTEPRSSPISLPWTGGIRRFLNWIGSTLIAGTNQATCGLSLGKSIATTSARSANYKPASQNLKRVYDLQNAGPRHRFTVQTDSGFLLVHNSGYQGGVTGYQTFAKAYGVKMADHWATISKCVAAKHIEKAEATAKKGWAQQQIADLGISELEWIASESCKLAWRAKHPATVKFWYDLQEAAIAAIKGGGSVYSVGQHVKVACRQWAGHRWLVVRLPSGNYLTYFEPGYSEDTGITYWGMASEEGSTVRAWVQCFTHGGKMTGNICQAAARDLLAYNMPSIDEAGFDLILSIHDEVLTETPDLPEFSESRLSELLSKQPPWAPDIPLAAAGFEAYRYKKE